MFRKLSAVGLIVAASFVAITAGAGPASAAVAAGGGTLTANGTGGVGARGLLDEQVTATNGILLVKDIGGGATIDVVGATSHAPFGEFTAYFGFTSAHITGTQVAVIVVGQDIDLTAIGRGWAYLKGTGTYTVNGGATQPWRADGGFAGIAAD